MERELEESTVVHSPGSHYHSQASARDLSLDCSSSDREEESDVSDMVVENPSRFQSLSRERRKSGGSDYHPPSESNSMSESDSASPSPSNSSGTNSTRSTPFSAAKRHQFPVSRLSDDDDDYEGASSRSISTPPAQTHSQTRLLKSSPVVRKSPLSVSHRSSPSVTAMRGYRYSMLPSRSAAMNVSYSRYLEGEESDSEGSLPVVRKRGRRLKESESEFEISGASESSVSEAGSFSEEFSEDEYQPPKRKARGAGGRRKVGTNL